MNSSFFASTELDRRDRRRLRRCRGGSPFGRWSSLGGSELFWCWFSFPDCAAAGVAVESWFMASLMSGLGAIASGLMMACRTCSGAGDGGSRGRGSCLESIGAPIGTGRTLARWKRWLVLSGIQRTFKGASQSDTLECPAAPGKGPGLDSAPGDGGIYVTPQGGFCGAAPWHCWRGPVACLAARSSESAIRILKVGSSPWRGSAPIIIAGATAVLHQLPTN